MCGIFGILDEKISDKELNILASHARQRGRDSSGLIFIENEEYKVARADQDIKKLLKRNNRNFTKVIAGHSRLITNSMSENQPVVRDGMILIHNGIIVNHEEIWSEISLNREGEIDSEVILAVAAEHIQSGYSFDSVGKAIMDKCIGTMSCAILNQILVRLFFSQIMEVSILGKLEIKFYLHLRNLH